MPLPDAGGLCPQLALTDNKELSYSKWLDRETEVERNRGKETIGEFGGKGRGK